jgi:hypothetical protein
MPAPPSPIKKLFPFQGEEAPQKAAPLISQNGSHPAGIGTLLHSLQPVAGLHWASPSASLDEQQNISLYVRTSIVVYGIIPYYESQW